MTLERIKSPQLPPRLNSRVLAIDRLYHSVRFDQLESCLEGFFVHVRNASGNSRTDRSVDWRAALEFVRDIFERRSRSDSVAMNERHRDTIYRTARRYSLRQEK